MNQVNGDYSDKEAARIIRLIETAIEGDFAILSPNSFNNYLNDWDDGTYTGADVRNLGIATTKIVQHCSAVTGELYQSMAFSTPSEALRVLNVVATLLGNPKQSATGNRWWGHQNGYSGELHQRFANAGFKLEGTFANWSLASTALETTIAGFVGSGELLARAGEHLAAGRYKETVTECADIMRHLVEKDKLKANPDGFRKFAARIVDAAKHGTNRKETALKISPENVMALMDLVSDARNNVSKTIAEDAFVSDEHGKHMAIVSLSVVSYLVAMLAVETKLIEEMFG